MYPWVPLVETGEEGEIGEGGQQNLDHKTKLTSYEILQYPNKKIYLEQGDFS